MQSLSPWSKGAIAGVTTFIVINLLLYFLTYGWFTYGGVIFTGPILGITFGALIAWCVKFANTSKKDDE